MKTMKISDDELMVCHGTLYEAYKASYSKRSTNMKYQVSEPRLIKFSDKYPILSIRNTYGRLLGFIPYESGCRAIIELSDGSVKIFNLQDFKFVDDLHMALQQVVDDSDDIKEA